MQNLISTMWCTTKDNYPESSSSEQCNFTVVKIAPMQVSGVDHIFKFAVNVHNVGSSLIHWHDLNHILASLANREHRSLLPILSYRMLLQIKTYWGTEPADKTLPDWQLISWMASPSHCILVFSFISASSKFFLLF